MITFSHALAAAHALSGKANRSQPEGHLLYDRESVPGMLGNAAAYATCGRCALSHLDPTATIWRQLALAGSCASGFWAQDQTS